MSLHLPRRAVALGALCLGAWLALPTQAHPDASAQITAAMKAQFERPAAPLTVAPVTVLGDDAVAGWTQDGRGGRALLKREHGQWRITVCAGAGLTQASVLQLTGLDAARAAQLAQAVQTAEARLSAEQRHRFDSFEGQIDVRQAGHGHGHGPSAGHGNGHAPRH
jgi:periplasmic copper chaperone A